MPETFSKRQKARDRQDKQRAKAEKRANKKTEPKARPADGEDPDIAGIVPGPQPIPDET